MITNVFTDAISTGARVPARVKMYAKRAYLAPQPKLNRKKIYTVDLLLACVHASNRDRNTRLRVVVKLRVQHFSPTDVN